MTPIDTSERLKYAQWLFEKNLAWIAQVEVKVAVVISIDIGMVSAVAAAYTTAQNKTVWAILLSVFFGIAVVSGLICSAVVVRPQTDGPKSSFVFFGRIAEGSRSTYSDKLKSASDDELLHDLSEQIHRNAEISRDKHHWVRLAIIWSFVSGVFWMAAVSQLVRHA